MRKAIRVEKTPNDGLGADGYYDEGIGTYVPHKYRWACSVCKVVYTSRKQASQCCKEDK